MRIIKRMPQVQGEPVRLFSREVVFHFFSPVMPFALVKPGFFCQVFLPKTVHPYDSQCVLSSFTRKTHLVSLQINQFRDSHVMNGIND